MKTIVFYSNDLQRELEVESINFVQNTFLVRVDKIPTRLDGADKLIEQAVATARAEALRGAAPYLQHKHGCDFMKGWPYHPELKVCTCGLTTIFADKQEEGKNG